MVRLTWKMVQPLGAGHSGSQFSLTWLPHLAQVTKQSMEKVGAGVVVMELFWGRRAEFPVRKF